MIPHLQKDDYECIASLLALLEQQPPIGQALNELQRKCMYTYQHSIYVALLSRCIGRIIGLHERELLELTKAGLLHDIGKTKLPVELLSKGEEFTEEECADYQKHTLYGFEMVMDTSAISHRVALVALQHHERYDGSGYPYGLKGHELYPHSKIVSVADVFHGKMSRYKVTEQRFFYPILQEMWHSDHRVLDHEITHPFFYSIMKTFLNQPVLLSNGEKGVIRFLSPNNPIYPIVHVNGKLVNLDLDASIRIERIL